MTRRRLRATDLTLPMLGLALTLPLAACGGEEAEPRSSATSPASSAAATGASEPSPSPSASSATPAASDSTADATPSPSGTTGTTTGEDAGDGSGDATSGSVAPAPGTPTPTGGRYGRLLEAAELPGFDDDWAWQEFETVPREEGLFTLCQRFLFADVGATSTVVRRFDAAVAGADGDNAGEAVSTFPDTRQAQQALAVMQAWAEDCRPEQDEIEAEVSPWTKVQTADATAYWYAVSVNPSDPEEARTERVTVVQRGTRLAVVRTQLLGEPRDFPPAQDPAALTARPTASKLGA